MIHNPTDKRPIKTAPATRSLGWRAPALAVVDADRAAPINTKFRIMNVAFDRTRRMIPHTHLQPVVRRVDDATFDPTMV